MKKVIISQDNGAFGRKLMDYSLEGITEGFRHSGNVLFLSLSGGSTVVYSVIIY